MVRIAAEKTVKETIANTAHKEIGLLIFGDRSAKPVFSRVCGLEKKTVNM